MHAEFCKSLAHPKRLEIMDALREGEFTVSELVKRTGISQANLSQHLALMRAGGALNVRREGASVYYRLADAQVIEAYDIIAEVLRRKTAEQRNMLAITEADAITGTA